MIYKSFFNLLKREVLRRFHELAQIAIQHRFYRRLYKSINGFGSPRNSADIS